MADVIKNSFAETNHHTKVIFQRGKDVLDFELNELQDCLRVFGARVAAMLGEGALAANDLKCTGDNTTANLAIAATSKKGYLVDGTPIRLEANTTLAIPSTAGTYKVYAIITQTEIADPAAVSELGATSRRNQYSITFAHTTGSLPADTSQELWEGGTRYRQIASVVRTGVTAIAPADVTDKRSLLPAYFVSTQMQSSGTAKMVITGDLDVTGILSPGTLALTTLHVTGTSALDGDTTFGANAIFGSTGKIRWPARDIELSASSHILNIDLSSSDSSGASVGSGGTTTSFSMSSPDGLHVTTLAAGSAAGYVGTVLNHDFDFITNNSSKWRVEAAGDLTSVSADRLIKGVLDPTGAQHAATKAYVDNNTSPNAVLNSAFDFWQRGPNAVLNASASAGVLTRVYGPDRWYIQTSDAAAGSGSQAGCTRNAIGSGANQADYEAQFGSGLGPSSGGQTVALVQEIDRRLVRSLRGKTVTLSAFLRDYAGVASGIGYTLKLVSGTGAETQTYFGGYTGSTTVCSTNANVDTLGSTFVRKAASGTIGSTVNSLAIVIELTGASGTDESSIAVTQVALHESSSSLVPHTWRRAHDSVQAELDACEAYFQKTYELDTAPGTSTANGMVRTHHDTNTAGSGSSWRLGQHIQFRRRMRTTPSVTVYASGFTSPNNGKIFFESTPADRATSVSEVTDTRATLTNNTGGASGALSQVTFHWTADAEI